MSSPPLFTLSLSSPRPSGISLSYPLPSINSGGGLVLSGTPTVPSLGPLSVGLVGLSNGSSALCTPVCVFT